MSGKRIYLDTEFTSLNRYTVGAGDSDTLFQWF